MVRVGADLDANSVIWIENVSFHSYACRRTKQAETNRSTRFPKLNTRIGFAESYLVWF